MKAYWLICVAVLAAVAVEAGTVRLADLEIEQMSTGWGQAQRGKSIVGEPLKIAGRPFTVGVGSHAPSYFSVNLAGKAKSFSAMVGVDDDNGKNGKGSLRFSVYADGRIVADSGVMKSGDKARALRADLTGARTAMLFIDDLGNDQFDHGDWCDAVIFGERPDMRAPELAGYLIREIPFKGSERAMAKKAEGLFDGFATRLVLVSHPSKDARAIGKVVSAIQAKLPTATVLPLKGDLLAALREHVGVAHKVAFPNGADHGFVCEPWDRPAVAPFADNTKTATKGEMKARL